MAAGSRLAAGDSRDPRAEASVLLAQGSRDEAVRLLIHAVELAPGNANARRDLGVLLGAEAKWDEAATHFREAARLRPEDAGILGEFGRSLLEQGDASGALEVLGRARRLAPGDIRLRFRWARALYMQSCFQEAQETAIECLEDDEDFCPALRLLGRIYFDAGHPHLALEEFEHLLALRPRDREAAYLTVVAAWHCGRLERSLELSNALVEAGVAPAFFHSFFVTARLHRPGETGETTRAAALGWSSKWGGPQPHGRSNRRVEDPERTLRIGYVTQEFAAGPAIHFIQPLLSQRSATGFEVFVYHTGTISDGLTEAARNAADRWREHDCLDEMAAAIAFDAIDILVDLSGHYGSHLSLFQSRHAPIQMTFPDCPSTTGAANMDYILTDRWVSQPGIERQYTETPVYLPAGYLPYKPPLSPPVTPLPAIRNGYVTFGMFQRPAKMNAAVWDAVAQAMREVRDSRLLIHYNLAELDDRASPVHERIAAELESRGVRPERLSMRGPAALADHLAILAEADVALDTFPYNGQTTTCECLWMGVPVVTLAGEIHVARVGLEILDRIGLGRLAATSAAGYVAQATSLASDLAGLVELRKQLRSKMERSPMVDGSVVRGIEEAYREVWKKWCLKSCCRPMA